MDEKIMELRRIINGSSNIVFFGGAGVSTESNIPDFRSEKGLYNAKQQFGCSPEEMLSHTFFVNHTDTFFDYYKSNLVYQDAKPNDAHKALASLEQSGKLKAIITQNVDGLHQQAGSKVVYELHGSTARNRCMRCGEAVSLDYVMDPANCDGSIPKCPKCGGIIKPEVVLYEECLDELCMEGAIKAISKAEVLIVGGTSLVVYPAAGMIRYFAGSHLVLINKQPTQYDSIADIVINDSIGKVLKEACEGI